MPRLSRAALANAHLCWLLTITYMGRAWRFSSYPVAPLDAAGLPVPHDGGMRAFEFEDNTDLLCTAPESRQASISVIWPEDVAMSISQGFDLGGAAGELALWVEGQPYESRMVLIDGDLVEPEYGADGEPVSFSLEESSTSEDQLLIPPTLAQVNDTTWPAPYLPDDAAQGKFYPTPFGTPGVHTKTDGTTGYGAGSPTLVVDRANISLEAQLLVVSWNHLSATQVDIIDDSGNLEMFALSYQADGLGRTVAVVDISGAVGLDLTSENFYACWSYGPALVGDDGSPVVGAGQLVDWMLSRTSVRVDRGRWAAISSSLDAYRVSGCIIDLDSQIGPLVWVVDNVLPILPVTLANGPDGRYPILYRLDSSARDVEETIEEGPGVVRVSPVTYDRGRRDVISECAVAMAYSLKRKSYLRTVRVTPDPDVLNGDDYASLYATLSGTRYRRWDGRRWTWNSEVIESDILWDVGTAVKVAAWRVRVLGFTTRLVEYEVDRRSAWLRSGGDTALTSSDLHISSQYAKIRTVTYSDTGIKLALVLMEDPVRDGL